MGYISLDTVVRGAIANKGHSTLHLYVPFLHWAFRGLEKFQQEGVYTDIKSTKDQLDENNCLPFPSDMKMWNKVGVVINGAVQVFVNDDTLSLDSSDHTTSSGGLPRGLFSYDSDSLNSLYTTNVYVATDKGVVLVSNGQQNSFKVNWRAKKFQFKRPVSGKVYLEYVTTVHDPSTATMINEIAQEYIENFIYYREARFKHGSSHRETKASEQEWLQSQDELRANLSDITGTGIMKAMNMATRGTIDQ